MLTPAQRSIRAAMAARVKWSREDPTPTVKRAQAGLREKFDRQVREEFPDLPESEILRRADSAFRAHMLGLALKSSKARQARHAGGGIP